MRRAHAHLNERTWTRLRSGQTGCRPYPVSVGFLSDRLGLGLAIPAVCSGGMRLMLLGLIALPETKRRSAGAIEPGDMTSPSFEALGRHTLRRVVAFQIGGAQPVPLFLRCRSVARLLADIDDTNAVGMVR